MIQLFLSHSKSIKANIVIPFSNDLSLLGLPYWFDRAIISSGDNIYSSIMGGIDMSSHCIAFIDDTYLHSEWPLRELEFFHEKEIQNRTTLIIPIFCGIHKETVYNTVPWLKDRAFEKIEQNTYETGERERIVCRIINRLLYELNVDSDISVLEQLLLHSPILPFYNMFNVLYNSKYYLSSDLRLSCIELCNILSLLNVVCNILGVTNDEFKDVLFKLPSYIKKIALCESNYLNYDFIVVLKRSINYVALKLLQFLDS